MSTRQAAAYLGVSQSWLAKDRVLARRVPYLKIGTKRVAYDRGDLDRFLGACRRHAAPA